MAQLPAEFKLGIFQRVADAVEDGEFSDILTAIKSYQKDGFATIKDGQTVLSAAGGGFSTTFTIPGRYNPQELFSFWTELRSIYTDALTILTSNSVTSPTHAQVRTQMEADDRFEAITRVQGDYTLLRCGGGL